MTEPYPRGPRPSPAQYRRRRIAVTVLLVLAAGGLYLLGRGVGAAWDYAGERWRTPSASESSTPPPEQSPAPDKVKACRDEDLSVAIELPDGSDYQVGDTPVIQASISYLGNTPCLRDLGARANEVLVSKPDGREIWSSNTCPANKRINLVTLLPGDVYRLSVTWPGTRNPTKCGQPAKGVMPGNYQVVATNGETKSAPVTISLN